MDENPVENPTVASLAAAPDPEGVTVVTIARQERTVMLSLVLKGVQLLSAIALLVFVNTITNVTNCFGIHIPVPKLSATKGYSTMNLFELEGRVAAIERALGGQERINKEAQANDEAAAREIGTEEKRD